MLYKIYQALRLITWIILIFLVLMTLSKLLPQVYEFFQSIAAAIRRLLASGRSAADSANFGINFGKLW